jgi:hypothetical protein
VSDISHRLPQAAIEVPDKSGVLEGEMNMKPELKHYPCWLRELLFPTDPYIFVSKHDARENEQALRKVFDNQRTDPAYRVLSMCVLEVIRYRFKTYDMQQSFQERISDLEERIEKLENKKKTKEQP